jgi:phosphoglycolate phosphatase-like HAD superfamily hydrolase
MGRMQDKLILFDVDGTLIDTAGAGRRAMEYAFREVLQVNGFERTTPVEYAGRTDPVIFDAVAAALGLEPAVYREHKKDLELSFVRALEAEMRRPDEKRRVLPGVRALLETLEAREGVHLGLLTGNLEVGARIKLEAFDLNRFFPDGGFASDDPDRGRIGQIAYRKLSALTGINFRAEDVTVVGDTHHDVACARVNGFRSVAVDSGWVPRETLERAGPDAVLDHLDDPGVMQALGLSR